MHKTKLDATSKIYYLKAILIAIIIKTELFRMVH